jgi:ligand-binding SRPBCC domain-containing protein
MVQLLKRTQFLPIGLGEAWSFFSDPANLSSITPDWLSFTMTCEAAPQMYAGQILSYTIRPFPLCSLSWLTEITHVDEPHFFVDEQRMGPYAFWHHAHHFRQSDGGVLMDDIVHYKLPFGPLGGLVHALYVRKQLQEIFDYRKHTLEKLFPVSEA